MYNVYHIGSKYELPDEPYSVAGLKRKLDNLKRNNLTHSEEYNKVLHNYESLINRGDPLFVNMGMWKGYMESALFSASKINAARPKQFILDRICQTDGYRKNRLCRHRGRER